MYSEFQTASTATVVAVCAAAFIIGAILLFILLFGAYLVLKGMCKSSPANWTIATNKGMNIQDRVEKTKVNLKNNRVVIDLTIARLQALKLKGRNNA